MAAVVEPTDKAKRKCSSCKQLRYDCKLHAKAQSEKASDLYRCSPCNRLFANMKEALEDEPELRSDYKKLSRSKKSEFVASNHELMGKDLKMKVLDLIVEEWTNHNSSSFAAGGQWTIGEALDQKYSYDPEVAKNIKDNSRSFFCHVKKRMMYHDV